MASYQHSSGVEREGRCKIFSVEKEDFVSVVSQATTNSLSVFLFVGSSSVIEHQTGGLWSDKVEQYCGKIPFVKFSITFVVVIVVTEA